MGLGRGRTGLVWTGPPSKALQCAAGGGCGLGVRSKGVWKDACGTPAQSGGCWERAWPWCASLVVVGGGSGLGTLVCTGSAGCLSKTVSALKSAEPPQLLLGQCLSIPGGGCDPAAPPGLPAQPRLKRRRGGRWSQQSQAGDFCPQPCGEGTGLIWLEGRCGRGGSSCSQGQPGRMYNHGRDGEGSQPLIPPPPAASLQPPRARPDRRGLSSRCSCA